MPDAEILLELIRGAASSALGIEPRLIERELRIADSGIDSLGLIEVAVLVEDELGVVVPVEAYGDIETIEDLILKFLQLLDQEV